MKYLPYTFKVSLKKDVKFYRTDDPGLSVEGPPWDGSNEHQTNELKTLARGDRQGFCTSPGGSRLVPVVCSRDVRTIPKGWATPIILIILTNRH